MKNKSIYIAGPMQGYPEFNFPSFDNARDFWKDQGWEVLSPADIDREHGFDPSGLNGTEDVKWDLGLDFDEILRRDFDAIMEAEAMAMLPGWRLSTGAKMEYWIARFRHLPVYDAVTGDLLPLEP